MPCSPGVVVRQPAVGQYAPVVDMGPIILDGATVAWELEQPARTRLRMQTRARTRDRRWMDFLFMGFIAPKEISGSFSVQILAQFTGAVQ
jgi:hypothetical protein